MTIDAIANAHQNFPDFSSPQWWTFFHRVFTWKRLLGAIQETGSREQRRRKLPTAAVMLLAICINLFSRHSISAVFAEMVHGLALRDPECDLALPKKGVSRKRGIESARSR